MAPTIKPMTSVPRISFHKGRCAGKIDSLRERAQPVFRLQLNYLSVPNIFAAANFLEQFFIGRAV